MYIVSSTYDNLKETRKFEEKIYFSIFYEDPRLNRI